MKRRDFVRLCSSSLAVAAASGGLLSVARAAEPVSHQRARLADADGTPLKASSLAAGGDWVFFYPYVSTPAFLIRLDGAAEGGVGPDNSVVAFAAICPHQFIYAKKGISLFTFNAGESAVAGRSDVITCCAHNSVYDPAGAGKNIGGPAPTPLTGIMIEHDPSSDELYATGTTGDGLYQEFFKAFKIELNEEYGRGAYREEAKDNATAVPMSEFAPTQIRC